MNTTQVLVVNRPEVYRLPRLPEDEGRVPYELAPKELIALVERLGFDPNEVSAIHYEANELTITTIAKTGRKPFKDNKED